MARNGWYALGYLALGMGALQEFRRQAKQLPVAGTTGTGRSYNLEKPLPSDTLPGEDTRAGLAYNRAAGAILEKATTHVVRNIDERVSHIRNRIVKDSLKPEVREAAIALVSRKCGTRDGTRWCITPKEYGQEIRAIYEAVQNANSSIALRYVRDHLKVDQFTAANKLLRLRGGDCDDGTLLLGALLNSIGYPVRMRVIQDINSASWSHIFLLVGVAPGNPELWVPLDWSVYPFKPPGWEAPGAAQAAATGKPHGVVVKVKDYEV